VEDTREETNTNNFDFINQTSVGEIHSMYQDLFLTDMKKEVEDAQSELKQWKVETNTANREITILKKEQAQLEATLKRYRKMVQEMSSEHYPQYKRQTDFKSERANPHKRIETKAGAKFDTLSNQYSLTTGPQRAFTQADPLKNKNHKPYILTFKLYIDLIVGDL
jgi:paraquat-inducible protein B